MGQPVVHFEFRSPEPEKATAFYSDVGLFKPAGS